MSAQIFTDGNFQAVGTDGLVVPNGKLYIYDNATGLLATTYQDSSQTITNTNPVILTASGKAKVFLANGVYDITLKTSTDAVVWTLNDYIADVSSSRLIGTIAALRLTPYFGQQIVSVTGYYTALDNIGVRKYYWDATSIETDNGGTIIQVTGVVTGRWKMKYSGAVNAKWFGAVGDGITDDTVDIQNTIDFVASIGGGTVKAVTGIYNTSSPIYVSSLVNIEGENSFGTIIRKTTNTLGVGSNTARTGTITDSYAIDAVIILTHSNNNYTIYSSIKNIRIEKSAFSLSSIAIYAPRVNHVTIEDVWVLNCAIGWYTFDAWMGSLTNVTVQACNIGFQHANDGSNLGTGTSITYQNCWINYDNTVAEPMQAYNFFGLTYSNLISCGIDNGIRISGAATYGYYFLSCAGISLNGCGIENTKGTSVFALSSSISIDSLRTISMTGVVGGTTGIVYADSSKITLTGCSFEAITSAGDTYNYVIQNGATVMEFNPASSPSGGNTFTSYSSGSSLTKYIGTAITRTTASGTTASAFPTQGENTVTLTAGTSGTITLASTHNKVSYHIVGKQITVTGQLYTSAISSPVGVLKIVGALPFPNGAAISRYVAISVSGFGLAAGATTALTGLIPPASSDITIAAYSAGGLVNLASYIQVNTSIMISATYIMD